MKANKNNKPTLKTSTVSTLSNGLKVRTYPHQVKRDVAELLGKVEKLEEKPNISI